MHFRPPLAAIAALALAARLWAAGGMGMSLTPCPTTPSDTIPRISRTIVIPRTDAAPAIDGRLDEPAWQRGAVAAPFLSLGSTEPASQQTTARLMYDDRALYIGFVCQECKMGELLTTRTEHDIGVWEDDCVEIFLDTNHNHLDYFQFIVTALGTRGDARWLDGKLNLKWNAAWEAKTARHADHWVAEVAVPFKTLGAQPGYWGLNLCREEQPHGELSCWAQQVKCFAAKPDELARFADALFHPARLLATELDLGSEGLGENLLALSIESRQPNARRVRAVAAVISPTGRRTVHRSEPVDLPANGRARPETQYAIFPAAPGTWQVEVAVEDVKSGERWAVGSYPLELDASSGFSLQSRIVLTPQRYLHGRLRVNLGSQTLRAGPRCQAVLAHAGADQSRMPYAICEQRLWPELCRKEGAEVKVDIAKVPPGKWLLTLRVIGPDAAVLVESEHPVIKLAGPFDTTGEAEGPRNLLGNPSFEDVGKSGAMARWAGRWWAPSGSSAGRLEAKQFLAADHETAHDGERSARIRSPREGSTSEALILHSTQRIAVQPGLRYKLTCRWKGQDIVGAAKAWLQTPTRQFVFPRIFDKSQADWQRFEGTFDPSPKQTWCQVHFILYSGRGTLWVDAVDFREDEQPYAIRRLLAPNAFKPRAVCLLDRDVAAEGLKLHVTVADAAHKRLAHLPALAVSQRATGFAVPDWAATSRCEIVASLADAECRVLDTRRAATLTVASPDP